MSGSGSSRLQAVFLDAGGVLVHPNLERIAEALRREGITCTVAALAAAEPKARAATDVPGKGDADRGAVYYDRLLSHAGIAPTEATQAAQAALRLYHAQWNLWESVPTDVVPSLERLRAAGLRLAVVSNANGTLHAHLGRLGLSRFFEAILDSQVEGVEKPDPRIFERALERCGVRAESTAHVGDLYHVDVVGARSAGLKAVLLQPDGLGAPRDVPRFPTLAAAADALLQGAV